MYTKTNLSNNNIYKNELLSISHRINQDSSEEQMSDEKTEYTTIDEARTEALQSAKLLVRNGCDEIINDSNIGKSLN